MSDAPTVQIRPFTETDDVVWRDGKARCRKHPYICLVPHPIGPWRDDAEYVGVRCWRDVREAARASGGTAE